MHVIFGKILFHRNISLYDMMEAGKDAHCGEAGLNGIYEKSGVFSKRIFCWGRIQEEIYNEER